MTSSALTYRLILLGLLPCIALILYVSGQSYDPALIDFKTVNEKEPRQAVADKSLTTAPFSQPAEQTVTASQKEEIAGLRLSGTSRHFTKDNLFEHVDGHAEYFISAGFRALTVSEYSAAGAAAKQPQIEVEVYDMGKGLQAFGVLVDESGDNGQAVSVGAMGFRTSAGINFIKSSYYVKISSFDPKLPVLKFARAFSETLPVSPAGEDSFSKGFSRFPEMGKAGKTKFVKEGYRGLDFLRNVLERDYVVADKKVTVALMSGSAQEMKALSLSFMDYFKKSGIRYDKLEKNGIEVYKITDKYEGNWFLIPGRDTIFAVFGSEDEDILKYFFKRKV
ncbi:MAG: hypothetical protein HQL08_05990 [Nitrospirae bacterium]|nr:hypothetical protein [Nitrospirota bacterium]